MTDNRATDKMKELLGIDDFQNGNALITLGDCDEVVLVGFYITDDMDDNLVVAWVYKDGQWVKADAKEYDHLI